MLLDKIVGLIKDERVRRQLSADLDQAIARRRGSLLKDDFLDQFKARGIYRRFRKSGGICGLRKIVRRLGIPLEELFQVNPAPWHQWNPGSVLHVIVGERLATIPEVGEMKQRVVGARDVQAVEALHQLFYDKLKLVGVVRVHLLPVSHLPHQIEGLLDELVRDRLTGAIICIGGPNVNLATDVLARRICQPRTAEQLPARFQWNTLWDWRGAKPFLTQSRLCELRDEGICLKNGDVLRRYRDQDVQRYFEENRESGFNDYGLLIVSARRLRSSKLAGHAPLLICAAGHGGLGTLAAIWALEDIGERLGTFGRDRCFEVITVRRELRRRASFDIFEAGDVRGEGWDFYPMMK